MRYLVFDGGYSNTLGVGTWAVVLVDNGRERLLEYGHEFRSNSTNLEWTAARRALEHAKLLGVSIVYGDYEACLRGMSEDHPEIDWRWVPSKGNVADRFTKYYPEVEGAWHTPVRPRGDKGVVQCLHG